MATTLEHNTQSFETPQSVEPTQSAETTRRNDLATNLTALALHNPTLADLIRKTDIPPEIQTVHGRDGTPTYQFTTEDKKRQYLGHTSIPTVRASALIETFGVDGGNAFFPGIATGHDVRLYLQRTVNHVAAFVYEPLLINIRLALTLVDVSQWLTSGRLILLTNLHIPEKKSSEDTNHLKKALLEFFKSHAGYDFPTRMLGYPHMSEADSQQIQQWLEDAARSVVALQQDQLTQSADRLASRLKITLPHQMSENRCSGSSVPRLCVISIDPRPSVARLSAGLSAAGAALDIYLTSCLPDGPDKCHHASRMQAIAENDANTALLLNTGWGNLGPFLPKQFASASWLLSDTTLVAGKTDGFRRNMPVFAATEHLKRLAIDCGADPELCVRLDPGADDSVYQPSSAERAGDNELASPVSHKYDVAIIADIADLSPESCGVGLTSHSQLWEHLCREAARNPERPAAELLAAGERSAGVSLRDEEMRRQLCNVIDQRVRPTLITQACAKSLLRHQFNVRVFGRGWQFSDIPRERWQQFPDDPTERNALYHQSRLILCPQQGTEAVQVTIDALLAGVCVVGAAPDHPLEDAYPQLQEVLQHVPMHARVRDMLADVRTLVRDDDARNATTVKARAIIIQRHLLRHRLQHILDALSPSLA